MTLDHPVSEGLAPALSTPGEADRFPAFAPAVRSAVVIGLAVSILGHAILIGLGVARLQSIGVAPNAETIPIQLVPDPSANTAKNEKVMPAAAPDRPSQAKPTPSVQPQQKGTSEPPAQVGSQPTAATDDRSPDQASPPQAKPLPSVATRGPVKTKMTQGETDALRAQIQRCWRLPQGWADPQQVSVVVGFAMSIDGAVIGAPAVIEFQANRYGVAAAKSALQAVVQCGPYRLPASTYGDWREAQIRLTPGS